MACVWITADADLDTRNGVQHRTATGEPQADDDGFAVAAENTCQSGPGGLQQPAIVNRVASITTAGNGSSGRLTSFWSVLGTSGSLDKAATLRWRINSATGSTVLENNGPVELTTDEAVCGTRSGLFEALVASGQLATAPTAATCVANGYRFTELTVNVAQSFPCGEYTAEAKLTSGRTVSTKALTFTVVCGPSFAVEFTSLDLPELRVGNTDIFGDLTSRSQAWTIVNNGNVPLYLSVTFSPMKSVVNGSTFGTIQGRLRQQGSPVTASSSVPLLICPGYRAVLDVGIEIPTSTPLGGFSSSMTVAHLVAPVDSPCTDNLLRPLGNK